MSISLVCLFKRFHRKGDIGGRGGVRELEFSSSYIMATWGCRISMWKVKMDNELERRMRWEGGEERPGNSGYRSGLGARSLCLGREEPKQGCLGS